jgi:predicted nucleic acid-binding protein
MPATYFLDAWYIIAVTDAHDRHHQRALRVQSRLKGSLGVTHAGVLSEVLAFFAEEGQHARAQAVANVRDILRSADVIIPDRTLFLRALDRYAARPDKEYSLTDCLSMVVMEERGIREVLTNDHHFSQAGFVVVSE